MTKLISTFQTKNLDLSVIACMVDTTLHTLDDAIQPAANWVLKLLDKPNSFKELGIILTSEDIADFLDRTVKPFVKCLKDNYSSHFASSSAIVSALSIFDPKTAKNVTSSDISKYGEQQIETILEHYGAPKQAETLLGESITREAIITPDIVTEWKTYRHLLLKPPEDSMKTQLKELVVNDMMKTMFPNLPNYTSYNSISGKVFLTDENH